MTSAILNNFKGFKVDNYLLSNKSYTDPDSDYLTVFEQWKFTPQFVKINYVFSKKKVLIVYPEEGYERYFLAIYPNSRGYLVERVTLETKYGYPMVQRERSEKKLNEVIQMVRRAVGPDREEQGCFCFPWFSNKVSS